MTIALLGEPLKMTKVTRGGLTAEPRCGDYKSLDLKAGRRGNPVSSRGQTAPWEQRAAGGPPPIPSGAWCNGFSRHRLLKILERHAQALLEIDFGLPAEQVPGLGDIRTPLFGIVLRQRFVANL